jgi:hypothetical protein
MNMIGTTNKMFALDHSGTYASGPFPSASGGSCSTTCAPAPNQCPVNGPWTACALVCCKYLADQDWGDKSYAFSACDPGTGTGGGSGAGGGVTVCTSGANNTGDVASTKRAATNSSSPYSNWAYHMTNAGVITALNGAPPPTF